MASGKAVRSRKLRKNAIISKEEITQNEKNFKVDKESKRIKTRKIHIMDQSFKEKKIDKMVEYEDNMSIVVMIVILMVCFILGISLGYYLYKIAIAGVI